jgi:hypothetical protein
LTVLTRGLDACGSKESLLANIQLQQAGHPFSVLPASNGQHLGLLITSS